MVLRGKNIRIALQVQMTINNTSVQLFDKFRNDLGVLVFDSDVSNLWENPLQYL